MTDSNISGIGLSTSSRNGVLDELKYTTDDEEEEEEEDVLTVPDRSCQSLGNTFEKEEEFPYQDSFYGSSSLCSFGNEWIEREHNGRWVSSVV